MKILFLDIDGVVKADAGGIDSLLMINERIGLVKKITKETGAKIVLSSSWRVDPVKNKLAHTIFDILDVTPNLIATNEDRGVEIQQWLDNHPEVEKYAILDDTGVMLEHQQPSYFQTLGRVGLTEEIAEKVIEHLKN